MLVEQSPIAQAGSAGVDVIIRYHRADRGLQLEMALLSVFNQTYSPIHVIIVTPLLSSADLAAITEIVGAYDWKERHVLPTIVSMDIPFGADARSEFLNSGLGFLRYRFAAFLDYEDYLYSHAYKYLTQIVQEDEAAVAFGGINVKHVRAFDTSCYSARTIHDVFQGSNISDFAAQSFCPIHSFVVDRAKTGNVQLHFTESPMRSEGYDFLVRMALGSKFSFRGLSKKVGVATCNIDEIHSGDINAVDNRRKTFNNQK